MKYRNLLIFLFLFFLYGCCKSHYQGVISFSTEQRNVNPYNGNEILTFVDNSYDTVKYYGQYRKLESYERSDGGCADCCVDNYDVEMDYTYFTSPFMASYIAINMDFPGSFPPGDNKTPRIIFFWAYKDSLDTQIQTEFKEFPLDSMKEYATENGLFKDTIFLRTKQFNNVYISLGQPIFTNVTHGDTLFYTESEGIVGLKSSNGNLWVKE